MHLQKECSKGLQLIITTPALRQTLKDVQGNLKLISDYPLKIGQEVAFLLSYPEVISEEPDEHYVNAILNTKKLQEEVKNRLNEEQQEGEIRMSLTIFEGLQSEIFVPITPKPVWAPVTKELKDMKVALATAAGVHLKTDKRFNLAGDTTFREIPDTAHSTDLMVSHGGYDNADANKDINCMFPIDRLHELAKAGVIGSVAEYHYGFMGGGGDQEAFTNSTGPEIARKLKEENVDAVILTAG